MRVFALLIFLIPSMAAAVNLVCTVPNAVATRATELCEVLRLQLTVRSSDWNNNACASELLRQGLRSYERSVSRDTAELVARAAVMSNLDAFDTNFPIAYTSAVCGDSVVDAEFGEQCDPPDGSTCDVECQDM